MLEFFLLFKQKLNRKSIIVLFSAFIPLLSYSTDFEIDGIYYNYHFLLWDDTPDGVEVAKGEKLYEGNVVIPEAVDCDGVMLPVKSIGYCAFEGCEKLKSIVLPKGLHSIQESAFEGCIELNSVTINDFAGVEWSDDLIGERAFWGCQSLETISIPGNTKIIGSEAFGGCTNLKGVFFEDGEQDLFINGYITPDPVGTLFYMCPITEVYLGRNFVFERLKNGDDVENEDDFGYISEWGDELYIYRYRKNSPFSEKETLTHISFGKYVTKIEDYCFSGCTGIEDLTIPGSIVEIGKGAFAGCSELNFIHITSGKDRISDLYEDGDVDINENRSRLKCIGDFAFFNCPCLRFIEGDYYLERIGKYAFYYCNQLDFIHGEEQLRYIGDGAFMGAGLNFISLSPTIEYLGKRSFRNSMISEIDFRRIIHWNEYDRTETEVEWKLKEIEDEVFYGCPLKEIELPVSVETLGNAVFKKCLSLKKVIFPESLTSMGKEVFSQCLSLPELELPDELSEIGAFSFSECVELKEIKIPKSVKDLNEGVFSGCHNLKNIVLPDSMNSLGNEVFSYCMEMESITIPAGISILNPYLFYACQSLRSIIMPESVSTIEPCSFLRCDMLENIFIKGEIPPSLIDVQATFSENNLLNCTLYVPEEAMSAYKSSKGWDNFVKIKALDEIGLSDLEWELLKELNTELIDLGWEGHWNISNEKTAAYDLSGIGISSDKIERISFPSARLTGHLPLSVFKFPHLKELDLSGNQLYDNLTTSPGQLLSEHPEYCTELTSLNLSSNCLSGDLSEVANRCPSLIEVNVSNNRISEISKPLSEKILSLNIFDQNLDVVVDLDMSRTAEYLAKIPTLFTYNHYGKNYNPQPALSFYSFMYDSQGRYCGTWEVNTSYYNGGLSFVNADYYRTSMIYYGKNEALIDTRASNSSLGTFKTRLIFRQGDTNFDGLINISDLQSQIKLILEDFGRFPLNFTAADIVDDGYLNVRDVVGMVNLLMEEDRSDESYPVRKLKGRNVTGDASVYFCNEGLIIDASQPVSAFDIILNGYGGQTIGKPENISGFTTEIRIEGDRIHLIGYSLSGASLPSGSNLIASAGNGTPRVTYAALCNEEALLLNTVLNRHDTTGVEMQADESISVSAKNGKIIMSVPDDVEFHWSVTSVDGKIIDEGKAFSSGEKDFILNPNHNGVVIVKVWSSRSSVIKKIMLNQ